MIILDCAQGSDEWYAARLGLPTASEFKAILVQGSQRRTRTSYLHRLAAEVLTGEAQPVYVNDDMRRGTRLEPEAREAYAWLYEVDPLQVGFVLDDELRIGCSPDGLVGDDGLVEIKCPRPAGMVELMAAGFVPPEYRAQIQGCLWLTGRQWCDLVAYNPDMPLFVVREERSESYIELLRREVTLFREELDALVNRIITRTPSASASAILRGQLERSAAL